MNGQPLAAVCGTFHAEGPVMVMNIDGRRVVSAYPPGLVASWLRLPVATVRAWATGQHYERSGERHFFRPVIDTNVLAGTRRGPLSFSFVNLVELHVLSALRRVHEVPLPKVRKSIDYLRRRYPDVQHPLADLDLLTDGLDVWLEELGEFVAVSHHGQMGIRDIIAAHLTRVDRGEGGRAIRLYPFTRPDFHAEQPRSVVIDPEVSFGRPTIAGTGVPTQMIAGRFDAGESLESLADDYGCGLSDLQEALRLERRAA